MKTITVDEEQNWLQDNTKIIILKSFICACAAIFMNLIRNGLNDCKTYLVADCSMITNIVLFLNHKKLYCRTFRVFHINLLVTSECPKIHFVALTFIYENRNKRCRYVIWCSWSVAFLVQFDCGHNVTMYHSRLKSFQNMVCT